MMDTTLYNQFPKWSKEKQEGYFVVGTDDLDSQASISILNQVFGYEQNCYVTREGFYMINRDIRKHIAVDLALHGDRKCYDNHVTMSDCNSPINPNKRHSKYKSTAEYCNAPLEYWLLEKKETGRDDLDRPIYKEEWKLKRLEYAVQRKETNISVDSNQAINLFDYRYEFRIRDIKENVEIYTTNTEIRVNGHWFKVIEARRLKNGLLNVSVKDSSAPNGFPKDR
ncbi:hypothetical protein [Lysinibacillus sp. NPDC096212]|uniref:hypothetical protein n=1 Tax=Lysinibacillus sp. NPDC096212 TaxID=3364135 RepID=UPI003829CDB1